MSIAIEHEKRKREILEKALDVFIDEGYEDTTFQKISERCGITRTILYLYFKNKREIFSFSIKLFTEGIERRIKAIAADPGRSQAAKLSDMIAMVLEGCAGNRRLLGVVMDYLGHQRAAGGDADERVRRRTIRMRHILVGVLVQGQRTGEFGPFSVKDATDLVYSLIEAAVFRIAVLGREDAGSLAASAAVIADGLRARAPEAAAGQAATAAGSGAPGAASAAGADA